MKVAFDLLCTEFVTNLQTLRFGYDSSIIELVKINIRDKNHRAQESKLISHNIETSQWNGFDN